MAVSILDLGRHPKVVCYIVEYLLGWNALSDYYRASLVFSSGQADVSEFHFSPVRP